MAITLVGVLCGYAASRLTVRWSHPLEHRREIVHYARANGLRPSLVAALIRHESSFRPHARSPVGAVGLMQLMPTTARWVSEHLEGRPFSSESLLTPENNLRLGSVYLGHLRQRFGEQPVIYLAAYNAGPQQVEDWLQRQEGRLSIPEIPFPETRAYVASVLESQERYARLYPGLDGEQQ